MVIDLQTDTRIFNVLDEVKKEKNIKFEHLDEKIFSDLYYISLSHSLRAMAGRGDEEKNKCAKQNEWLEAETEKVHVINAIAFDNVTKWVGDGKKSCDVLFYNFEPLEKEQHFLGELKNVDKQTLLSFLNDRNEESILYKVKDSLQTIKKQLIFGGKQEGEDIVHNMHFFIVYSGKNNVATKSTLKLPISKKISRDKNNKQKEASRKNISSEKQELELYERFGKRILDFGLQPCSDDVFPGDALPRARKVGKGQGKIRPFSIFSARDFANIIEADFFTCWKWGEYQEKQCLEKTSEEDNS